MRFDSEYFLPLRSSYMFRYDNPCKSLMFELDDFYWGYFEHLFDYYEQLLLGDNYILTLAQMRDKAHVYVSQLANDYYEGIIDTIQDDLEHGGETICSEQTYLTLLGDARPVISKLVWISQSLIYQMFHHLYGFILSAKQLGIRFQSMDFKLDRKDTSVVVTCTIDTECIKRHDPEWYDRATLLADV